MTGLDEVQRNLRRKLAELEAASLAGLVEGGLEVQADSQKLTPVVTGNLRGSAYVVWKDGESPPTSPDKGVLDESVITAERGESARRTSAGVPSVAVGYAAVYAANVHENPRAGKTGGVSPKGRRYLPGRLPSGRQSTRKVYSTVGQWKFLETALKRLSKRVVELVTARVRGALGTGIRFR